MFRFCYLFAVLFALGIPVTAAVPATLRVVTPGLHPSSMGHAVYFPQLLRLALEKTRSEGPFEIRAIDQHLTSPRQATELKNNGIINLMWDGTNSQRESE
jgi:hypothetical protein